MARKYKANREVWVRKGASKEERLQARYEAYKRDYQSQSRKLMMVDEDMNKPMLTKSQYEIKYVQYKNELKLEVKRGERKGIGNVNQYIVRDQAYEISYKQEKALREFVKHEFADDLEELELKPKDFTMKLRQGTLFEELGVGDFISNFYESQKQKYLDEGMTPKQAVKEAKHDVSSTIFGSK